MICDNRARCRQIIPDFPDSLTPTVIMWPYSYSEGWCTGESEAKMRYKDKECIKKVQGLAEWGGSRVCREPKPGCVTRPPPTPLAVFQRCRFRGVGTGGAWHCPCPLRHKVKIPIWRSFEVQSELEEDPRAALASQKPATSKPTCRKSQRGDRDHRSACLPSGGSAGVSVATV